MSQINELIAEQKKFFATGKTFDLSTRRKALRALRALITENLEAIHEALQKDLGKSEFEGYMCETGLSLSELSHMEKHLSRYAKEHRVLTPMAQYVSRSFTKPSPYGTVLIMSPWNYPFLLTIEPLIDAIAAGNTAILKPSAYSPATSALLDQLVKKYFSPSYVTVVTGGREENRMLLSADFDYIFFTGSQAVGKEVMRNAAERLTPISLELGGKSPCIVTENANLKLAAKRIVFGKYLNCGQTCVAPDYIYCHESVKDRFLSCVREEIKRQYGDNPLDNKDYGKIINEKHYQRILGLIDSSKVVVGGTGNPDSCQIAPTVMDRVTWEDAVMQEEIFGPVMPILTYQSIDELIALINSKPSPLALYLFSNHKPTIKKVTARVQFGGGCINDTIIHLATSNLGFGGVGASGMGSYHGKKGFDTFSHTKSIVDKKTWLDLPMRYQPYKSINQKLVKMFLK